LSGGDESIRWRPWRRPAPIGFLTAIGLAGSIFCLSVFLRTDDVGFLVWAAAVTAVTLFGVLTFLRTGLSANAHHIAITGAVRSHRFDWDDVVGQEPKDGAHDDRYVLLIASSGQGDTKRWDLPRGISRDLISEWRRRLRQ
jgi:hypothetical protein